MATQSGSPPCPTVCNCYVNKNNSIGQIFFYYFIVYKALDPATVNKLEESKLKQSLGVYKAHCYISFPHKESYVVGSSKGFRQHWQNCGVSTCLFKLGFLQKYSHKCLYRYVLKIMLKPRKYLEIQDSLAVPKSLVF